jgi:hypothetical protein
MNAVSTLELAPLGMLPYDNSALRARLAGQTIAPRSIEAELRAAMRERQVADPQPSRRSAWR